MSARMAHFASFWCKDDVMTGSGMGYRWPGGKRDRGLIQPEVTWFDNRKSRDLEGETADQFEKRDRGLIQPEVTWFGRRNRWRVWKKDRGLNVVKTAEKTRAQSPKSNFYNVGGWDTADQMEKGIAGSYNRESRDLEGETAGECEKRIVGSMGVKTAEKTRAQSPKSNFCNVGGPSVKEKAFLCWKKYFNVEEIK